MPLQYFFLSLGFCLLTQVTRNAEVMKVDVRDSTAKVTGYLGTEGSVEEGTAFHTISGIDVELNIDSDSPGAEIAELVRRAEAMCFVTQAVRGPVDMTLNISHNQQPLAT
jgi:organic hydroperoxide reductase OsmC/OhrA